MATEFLELGSKTARATILLAHGAGAPMDSLGMIAIAKALAAEDVRVVRFEFAYIAAQVSVIGTCRGISVTRIDRIADLPKFIEYACNATRLHSALCYLSPNTFEKISTPDGTKCAE